MRFVRLKTVVTKICDQQVQDENEIVTLLNKLKEKEFTCSIRLFSGPVYSCVRILEVNSPNFKWRTTKNGSSLIKNSSINDLDYLELDVKTEVIAKLKPNQSRWSLIDSDADLNDS